MYVIITNNSAAGDIFGRCSNGAISNDNISLNKNFLYIQTVETRAQLHNLQYYLEFRSWVSIFDGG